MNNLIIIGSVGNQPEMRATKTGHQVCTFNVAVNERRKGTETTTWFRVTTWGNLAETCNQYVSKGKLVSVIGSVSANAYKRKDGEVACSLEVNAREVEFLGGKRTDEEKPVPEGFTPVDPGDDLPF